MLLQNHPGLQPYPAQPWRMSELPDQRRALVQAPGVLGALAVLLGIFTIGLGLEAPEPAPSVFLAGGGTIAVGLAMIAASIVLIRRAARAPLQEQQRYYALANLDTLAPAQRQALQLDGVNTGYGAWCETLEDWPCEARVGQPQPPFRTFVQLSTQQSLEELDQNWGVVTADDYRRMVRQLHEGMHSRSFAGYAASPEFSEVCGRLSSLLGWSPGQVAAAAHPRNGAPPELVWGFDLWRALRLSRDAFMAGLISEDEAWKNILTASAWIHTLFPSLDAFHDNLRLGHAFWSNDLQKVNERKQVLETYTNNAHRRPILDLPWTPAAADLPAHVRDGFAAQRAGAGDPFDDAGPPDDTLLH